MISSIARSFQMSQPIPQHKSDSLFSTTHSTEVRLYIVNSEQNSLARILPIQHIVERILAQYLSPVSVVVVVVLFIQQRLDDHWPNSMGITPLVHTSYA